ncbi:hypothetical protein M1O54_08210 [Dehalococcoidia bacterium]|nr:hypothetical protein [Dehalococcoidia bacterium]
MSLARGIRGNYRKKVIYDHRLFKFLECFDNYAMGRASWAHLKVRGDKMVQIRKR